MAQYKDYYKILGVGKTASDAEIKKAFKTQARKCHPDMHPENEKAKWTEKFKDLNEAYTVLSDKQKRTIYDQVGQEDFQNYARGGGASRASSGGAYGGNPYGQYQQYTYQGDPGAGFGGFSSGGGQFSGADFSDFFQSIFGGMGGMGGFGQNFGRSAAAGQSSGDVEAEIALNLEDAHRGGNMQLTIPSGRTVTVKFPAGVSEGKKIKLKGMGNPTRRGQGDLYLIVKIRPHAMFRLEGEDLHVPVVIMPWTAALGGTISVPTLDGPVQVKVPAGTHNGKKLKLSGKGLSSKGSLFVTLTIDVPRTLSKEQRDLFVKLAQLG
ncbi:MAG: DnaJ domain-containing protein [Elusimicrobiaceae bacterium]|nr:DnaJ domain-containing protein [Elusimicrobiaceae bacterium]MBP5616754.1 DnaJ domain-containing protein [Elusimicrobiaceae bacterium]